MHVLTAESAPRSTNSVAASTCPNARNPKRRPITLTPLIDRGTRIEQQAGGGVDVPFQTRNEQWRIAVIILLVDASALLKKSAYRGEVILVAC